jgi:hypothetical protein
MIENYNETNSGSNDIIEYKKYLGVASVNVLCVNPDNAKLKMYGWNVPDNAEEPQYIFTKERNGKPVTSTKIRILVQIQDLEDKPIIPLDFWIGPEVTQNADGSKGKIIDNFGRTAWGTRDEIRAHQIPQYKNGEASISQDYRMCHRGEEELIRFIFKYLNITPLQVFSRSSNGYENTKNPGKFAFDDWQKLCNGNVKELEGYLRLQPNNQVKVLLGIRTNEENRSYQTFMNNKFLSNGIKPDKNTGEYTAAKNAISKYFEERNNSTDTYSAAPVKEWTQTATTDIKDNSGKLFDDDGNFVGSDDGSDLPFSDFPV